MVIFKLFDRNLLQVIDSVLLQSPPVRMAKSYFYSSVSAHLSYKTYLRGLLYLEDEGYLDLTKVNEGRRGGINWVILKIRRSQLNVLTKQLNSRIKQKKKNDSVQEKAQ